MGISRRSVLRLTSGLIGARAASAAAAPSAEELAAMERVASAFLKTHSVPGLSVAIANDGALLYERGFGVADQKTNEPVTPAHLFRIASVSKPVTSVAIFQLIEQKRLTLDHTIFGPSGILGNDYGKPPFKRWVDELRVKHLLTHTAGGWRNDGADPMFQNTRMTHRELISWAIADVPLRRPPGEEYAYSNFGYCILGRVIEKLTGASYEQHVRDAVLKPCGVTGMRIAGNTRAERARNEVVYYAAAGEDPYGMNVRRMDSHGGWLASARDLAMFASHVDGHAPQRNILAAASIREMTTPSAANPRYAKGWSVNDVPNWWHGGSLPGTASIMVRTARRFCWAAIANSNESSRATGGAMDQMMWDMARQVKSWNV